MWFITFAILYFSFTFLSVTYIKLILIKICIIVEKFNLKFILNILNDQNIVKKVI